MKDMGQAVSVNLKLLHCFRLTETFALRAERMVNAYRKISISKLELSVSGVPLRERVGLRIVPDKKSGLAEVRFWYDKKLVGIQKVRNEDLNILNF